MIQALENEFRREAPGLQVAKGEERAILVGLISEGHDAFQVDDEIGRAHV